MTIDITKFEDVKPTKGGKSSPVFSLGKQGYFNGNANYIEENKEFKKAKSVNMKATKEGDRITILLDFVEDKSGDFGIGELKDKKGEIKRKSFSGRSIFKKFGLSYKNFAQRKTLKLNPKREEIEGKVYFIVEIDIT